jgi:hypothetical protein
MDNFVDGQYQKLREQILRMDARFKDITGVIRKKNPYLLTYMSREIK